MRNAPGRVLVIGDVMTDVIVQPEGPLVRGSDRRAAIASHPGGSGANQAMWLADKQVPVGFVARVGAADVTALAAHFAARGVTPLFAADRDAGSGVLVTIVDPDGERSFLTDRGANARLSDADLPETLLDGTRVVMVSGYALFEPGPRAAVQQLAQAAMRRAIPVMVDAASTGFLNEVGPERFLAWTDGFHTLFANVEEAEALSGTAALNTQVTRLGASYRRVIIKRGAYGAALGGRDGVRCSLPAPMATVVDTTGAGDAFAAGFLAAELGGMIEDVTLGHGIAAGSAAIGFVGGQPRR
ncbi:carbohydrate kinase family protein [Devosia sp.]|uniref:carbohydrate kinase family protein n=1 Tax=Devosia sp. TaxID=1871048 RepID=UPI003A95753E